MLIYLCFLSLRYMLMFILILNRAASFRVSLFDICCYSTALIAHYLFQWKFWMDRLRRVGYSCFATKPMPFCCAQHIKESTSTRFLYCCILTVVSILSAIFHTGGIAHGTVMRVVSSMIIQILYVLFHSTIFFSCFCVRLIVHQHFCMPLLIVLLNLC